MDREFIAEIDPDLIVFDNCDSAIIGVIDYLGTMHVAYSYLKLVEHFMEDMTEEEARERIDHNMMSAYMGEKSLMIVNDDIGD